MGKPLRSPNQPTWGQLFLQIIWRVGLIVLAEVFPQVMLPIAIIILLVVYIACNN